MADVSDQATDQEFLHLAEALKAQAAAAASAGHIKPQGYCLNPRCGEDFPAGSPRLFCNAECETSHKRLTRN